MKKRILSLVIAMALLITAMPMLPISASDTVTEVWKNGGISLKDVDAVTDLEYGFKKVNVTDARGYITAPNLDEKPYYMLLGMDGQFPGGAESAGGRWAQLQLSNGERNCNWFANNDIYIIFPNSNASPRNITVKNSKDGAVYNSGVPFMPQTAYVFKFAKEQNSEGTDVLAIYCNGVKVFEGAEELSLFSTDKLWFTTKGNQGAYDTFQTYPLLINPTSNMTEDPDFYFTTGPKTGCDGYSAYSDDIVAENMLALYDDEGYARAVIDSTHNDGGWPERVGESVSGNIPNPNNKISVTIVPDSMNNGNWHTIGIYDPSDGEKSFAQSQYTLRIGMSGNSNIGVVWAYLNDEETQVLTKNLVIHEQRLDIGKPFKVGFELVEGETDRIDIYYNDLLIKSVLETDENVAKLFDVMRAETLRVGIVGNKNAEREANVIRFKVDNGNALNAKLSFDKEAYNVGDYINTTLTLKNNADKAISNVKVSTLSSAQIATADDTLVTVDSIAAGETVEIKQKLRAIEGGRPMHRVTVSYGTRTVFDAKKFVSINGAGWYEGDSHSHSTYSDGTGTVAENSASAYEKGLSWLYSTDHNSISQYKEAAAINAGYASGDFINIAGNEVSSFNRGHGLAYRIPYDVALSNWSDTENQAGWNIAALGTDGELDWGDIIADIKANGGFFYPAHPNHDIRPSANIIWRFDEYSQLDGITGIEVWNASYIPTDIRNTVAFKYWDQLNVRGDKVFGISNSDAHGTAPIGAAHIKGYLESLSIDNINNLLESGSYYGTNGPDLFFDINGIAMGKTLKIGGDSSDAAITVKASDDNYPLTKVTLYKLHVTGETSEEAAEYIQTDASPDGTQGWYVDGNLYTDTKEVVKTWDLAGQNVYSFSEVVNVTVNDGDFYRIEVESEKNTYYNSDVPGDENNIGFAYSNPIWVEKADAANDFYISDIALNSSVAKLYETASGKYYVEKTADEGFLSADDLAVTVAGTVTLTSKKYDAAKEVFTITLTAADGTVKTIDIYVVGESSETEEFWKNGGISKSADLYAGYSYMGYGFTRLTVSDARGYVEMPNLDEAPYYMMLGMDGLMSGHWAQLHISNGERNPNWNPEGEIYISFPNDSTPVRNITVKSTTGGAAYNDGVRFIPQTAYIFKFVKEQNAEGTDVLAIYCNGVKVFENAESLNVFTGKELWFKTMGKQGADDTFTLTPLIINPTSSISEDPDFYTLAGPKGGQHSSLSTWFNIYGVLDENMLALYDDEGYTRAVIDSKYNDGGDPTKVGESISAEVANPNKEFEISVIADSLNAGNWCTIGIYDPSTGVKSFGESQYVIAFNMNNGSYNSLGYRYINENGGISTMELMKGANRVVEGVENKLRFELVDEDTDIINIYYNGELVKSVLETDANVAELFGIMKAETVMVGIAGNKSAEPDVIRFKINNSSTSVGSLALDMTDGATIRDIAPEGLRFETTVSGIDTLPEDAVAEFGTIIAPIDIIADTEFTHDALTAGGKQFLDIETKVWDGNTMKAVISNIKETNQNRDFAARGYAKVTFGNGTVKWLYAEQVAANIAEISSAS